MLNKSAKPYICNVTYFDTCWVEPCVNVSKGLWGQRRPGSACTYMQSNQGLHILLTESLDTTECMNGKLSPRWYFVHAQDDLTLHVLCMFEGTFCSPIINVLKCHSSVTAKAQMCMHSHAVCSGSSSSTFGIVGYSYLQTIKALWRAWISVLISAFTFMWHRGIFLLLQYTCIFLMLKENIFFPSSRKQAYIILTPLNPTFI